MVSETVYKPRWDPYLLKYGTEFRSYWGEYLNRRKRNILFVLGLGFDPRMTNGLQSLIDAGGDGQRDCVLIEFNEGQNSYSHNYRHLVQDNVQLLNSIIGTSGGTLTKKYVSMWSQTGDRRRTGSLEASKIFSKIEEFEGYTDVVLDVSSLPRGIAFPLITKLLSIFDGARKIGAGFPDFHVIVAEDTSLDKRIQEVGLDEKADYIHGFRAATDLEAIQSLPLVWIPVLGEGKIGHLERIHTLIKPEEICPILPFPSMDPRRGDNLLIEYSDLLFSSWLIEPRSIMYISEKNPFQVYRRICYAVFQYNRALKSLGGCRVVISAASSKLLSLGGLLSAYDLKCNHFHIGLAHIEAQGYEIEGYNKDNELKAETDLFTLWLTGGCNEE